MGRFGFDQSVDADGCLPFQTLDPREHLPFKANFKDGGRNILGFLGA